MQGADIAKSSPIKVGELFALATASAFASLGGLAPLYRLAAFLFCHSL